MDNNLITQLILTVVLTTVLCYTYFSLADESLSSAMEPAVGIDKTVSSAPDANSLDLYVELSKNITSTGDSLDTNDILSTVIAYSSDILVTGLVTGLVIGGLYYLSPYLNITVNANPSTRSAIANLAIDAVVGFNNAIYSIINLFYK